MTKDEFLKLLKKSSKSSYDFAKRHVTNKLPTDFKYSANLNSSFDNPTPTEFDIYPEDNGKIINLIDENEVVELLCRKGKVPVWIDISIESVYKNKTIFRLDCAGRYSDDEKEFYYNQGGTGVFGIKSPILPIGYKEGQKFKLKNNYSRSLFTILKKYFK